MNVTLKTLILINWKRPVFWLYEKEENVFFTEGKQ